MGHSSYWTRLYGIRIFARDLLPRWERDMADVEDDAYLEPREWLHSKLGELPPGVEAEMVGDDVLGEGDWYVYYSEAYQTTQNGMPPINRFKASQEQKMLLVDVVCRMGYGCSSPDWHEVRCYG